MRKWTLLAVAGGLACLSAGPASADVFGSYNCTDPSCSATVPVTGGSFDLVSNPSDIGSGVFLQVTGTLMLDQVTNLSAEYDMTTGAFGGGAPRFTIFDTTSNTNNAAYVYWGTPLGGGTFSNPNANGTFNNTGNYADLTSSDIRVYVNGFGGQSTPNTGETWDAFVAALGSTDISFISLDLDAGSFTSPQEMLVSNFTVNNEVDTPVPTAVPEPGSLSLLGTFLVGFSGLAFLRRKRG